MKKLAYTLTEYQSLNFDERRQIHPEPGMAVSIQIGSDTYSLKIYRVSDSGKSFYFTWHGEECRATWSRAAQEWRLAGKGRHYVVYVGLDYQHMDPSF